MKATLVFDSEERSEFVDAANGSAWRSVVEDLNNELRTTLKHGDLADAEYDALNSVREKLFERMNEAGLTMDDIGGPVAPATGLRRVIGRMILRFL
jgi:hypothetical protein